MSDYGYDARTQQHLKDQHIAELRKHNPVARQTPTPHQPGTTAFSIGLQLKDRTIITMRIALGKEFPQAPPVIQMLCKCSHPWLSQDGYYCVQGHRGLQNWTMSSNLGRVVSEIVSEFCVRPPTRLTVGGSKSTAAAPSTAASQPSYQPPPTTNTPLGITSHHQTSSQMSTANGRSAGPPHGGGIMPPSYSTGSKTTDTRPQPAAVASTKSWSVPQVGTTFSEVRSLSATEIQTLMDDDEAFDTFCDTVDGVQQLSALVATLRKKNGKAAEENLSHEEEILSLKTEINSLHGILKEKKNAYEVLVERQRAVLSKSSPEELIRKLKHSADQLENESEELADEYVGDDYDGTQKQWQKEFLKSRELFHRRKAMISRFDL